MFVYIDITSPPLLTITSPPFIDHHISPFEGGRGDVFTYSIA